MVRIYLMLGKAELFRRVPHGIKLMSKIRIICQSTRYSLSGPKKRLNILNYTVY